jgi:hypothetical protein
MTKEELAAKLNGREYGEELYDLDMDEVKENNLVIIYGASDDLIEFDGAINDESGCCGGGKIKFDKKGVIPEWDEIKDALDEDTARVYLNRKENYSEIEAVWCSGSGYSWEFKTDIPHACFDIMDEGEKYCRGIVISLDDMNQLSLSDKREFLAGISRTPINPEDMK